MNEFCGTLFSKKITRQLQNYAQDLRKVGALLENLLYYRPVSWLPICHLVSGKNRNTAQEEIRHTIEWIYSETTLVIQSLRSPLITCLLTNFYTNVLEERNSIMATSSYHNYFINSIILV